MAQHERIDMAQDDLQRLDAILGKHTDPKEGLIALLQDIQEAFGYLPAKALAYLSGKTGIPLATLTGVATFYAQFRLKAPGKYQVLVCTGTACHVNGAGMVSEAVAEALGVEEGETTEDGLFSWEKVACLGCCSLSPVMMINGRAHGKLTASAIHDIFASLRQKEETCQ